jgi:hypothetical protein
VRGSGGLEQLRDPTAAPVGPGVRRFALAFLAVFLACSLGGIEAWPLTGWNLYSRARSDEVARWRAVTVDHDGGEHGIVWDALPVAYRNTYRQLPDLAERHPTDREPVCRAWAEAVRDRGQEVTAVRVYWVEGRRRFDGTTSVVRRHLGFTCAEGSR